MESYLKALKVWPYKGVPENPVAWLYTVSYRSVLDEFKKKHNQNLNLEEASIDPGIEFEDKTA